MLHMLGHARAPILPMCALVARRMGSARCGRSATSDHSIGSLIRSIVVYRMCALPFMPRLFAGVLRVSKNVPIANHALMSIVRHTVFRQFCGGETVEELGALAATLKSRNICAIVDYAAEPEIASESEHSEQHMPEEYFESVAENIRRSIGAAKSMDRAIVAVKCTGLFDSRFLRQYARAIRASPNSTITDLDTQLQDWHRRGMGRLESLCKSAKKSGVSVTIDAEQSHLQDSIDILAMECMAKFNAIHASKSPVVLNTYQMYRMDGLQRLTSHLMLSQRDSFHFGCKVVRGAYLDWERSAAQVASRQSIVMPSAEETHAQYDASVRFLVDYALQAEEASDKRRFHVMLATHNKASIAHGRGLATNLAAVSGKSGNISISFAQLYGMSDHVSEGLASRKLQVYKYLPYGPVHLVIPYLLRRVQENHTVFQHAQADGRVLQREILRRLLGIRSQANPSN